MFNPIEQKNQHYVPVFWQKRFADGSNNHLCLKRNKIQQGSAKKQMSGDWIYTTFDGNWNPSNYLEIAFGKFETEASKVFELLDDKTLAVTLKDQLFLRWFIAFSICRHPDTMSLGYRLGKKLANALTHAPSQSFDEFLDSISTFHISKEEATIIYTICQQAPVEQLKNEAEEIKNMSPQNQNLPEQISINSETIERVLFLLGKHNITVLDAPLGKSFILGDTPFPDVLSDEFNIPISSRIALHWKSGARDIFPEWSRRTATNEEVEVINKQQFDNSLEIVIGSSREVLEKYLN